MAKIEVWLARTPYGFDATDEAGVRMKMDNSAAGCGQGYGVSPMQSLLMALGGCSGIDVVSILKKQRQTIEGFEMKIEGARQQGVEPSLWENVKIVFELKGNIDMDKARRACQLSMDKYCSVAETLRKAGCELTWDVVVNK